MIVVSQMTPSPPELSTSFPHVTSDASTGVGIGVGGAVGGGVTIGGRVGAGVTTGGNVGGGVGVRLGGTVGDEDGDGMGVGEAVRVAPVGLTVGFAVAGAPLGATGDGGKAAGTAVPGAADPGATGLLVPVGGKGASDGVTPGVPNSGDEVAMAAPGVGDGGGPTRTMPDTIPPSQVVAMIATNGVKCRGTHRTVRDRADVTNR